MLIERVYIPEELGSNPDAAETVYDNEVHLETFKEYHSDDNWVINAVTQCNLLNFLYYLYLYSISGYMQDRRFSDDEYRQEYVKVVECLKRNTIDIETLSVLKDTVSRLAAAEKAMCPNGDSEVRRVRRHVHDAIRYEDRPGHIPGILTGCSVEDAVGKYYDLAVEALSQYSHLFNIEILWVLREEMWDEERGNYLLDCSSPMEQHCYKDMPELNDKEEIKIIARCREPFVTGEITIRVPPVHRKPDLNTLYALFSNLEKESEE